MRISRFVVWGLIALTLGGGAAFGQQYLVSTVAGTGGGAAYAGDGGPALSAQFSSPLCVAVDSKGNYYVADSKNFAIRMIAAGTGIISTIAGNGTEGFSGDGGPGANAQISTVEGLAVDVSGQVYISDTGNARIRIVGTNGVITTFAGTGTRGDTGDRGPAANAELFFPAGIAFDGKGNLYIADYGDGTVRKISPQGTITTAAGVDVIGFGAFPGDGGFAVQATLGLPYSIAVDESGNLFVGDLGTSSIREVTTDGRIHTYVPQVSTASLATDAAGNLYYADYRQNTVVKVYANGGAATIAGSYTPGYVGDFGPGIVAQFDGPYGVAVDSSANIYVADYSNNVIRFLQPQPSTSVLVTSGAANLTGPIAPGEIVTLFGAGFGPGSQVQAQPDGNSIIENNLAGTTVSFNGIPAPIVSTSPLEIAAQVPFELNGASQATVVVSYNGQLNSTAFVPVTQFAPQIFTTLSTGYTGISPLNSDGTVNTTGNAAAESSTITISVTGVGQTVPKSADGTVPTGAPFAVPAQAITATVNGTAATVSSASTASGLIDGILQVSIVLPSSVTTSSAVPVQVQVGTSLSQPVNIAVQ